VIASLNFQPPVIAHRGASAYAPENTLIAFTKAALLGIKWIEFDVMQAACGEPIIFHDETLERTTNGKGAVDRFDYANLRNLDAGSWFNPIFAGERIPNLMQTLEFLKNASMCANVEIKSLPGADEPLVKCVLNQMRDYLKTAGASILFSSFSIDSLKFLRQYSADCLIGFLMHDWLPEWEDICKEYQCVSMNVNEEIMTPERAQAIKATGRKLLCYTVNDPLRAKELYSWGVDAVFSDAPDKIVR
jgi:glycerophosphoryl diester phosphodiesterase